MTAQARLAALAARIEADPGALAGVRGDGDALAEVLDGEPGAEPDDRTDGEPGGPHDGQAEGHHDGQPEGHHDGHHDGELALRWRMAVVRAVMTAPPDGDAVRELYGELVDRYRDQPARLAALRPLGDEIRRLEADGTLASSLVARSDRRPHRR